MKALKMVKQKLINTRVLAWGALALSVGAVLGLTSGANAEVMQANSSWGPTRDVYEWPHGTDHVVFNSMTNNGTVGDEVNFVRICELTAGTGSACKTQANGVDKYVDTLDVVAGHKYQVWVYYHNNAASDYNASAAPYYSSGLARNVRLSMSIPEAVGANSDAVIKGTITGNGNASGQGKMDIRVNNTSTGEFAVWDTARLHTTSAVWLRYEPDSAVIHNGASFSEVNGKKQDPKGNVMSNGEKLDNTALFTDDGVYLSAFTYSDASKAGIIPACNEYAGYVTFTLVADQPGFYAEKTAKIGNGDYKSIIDAEPGDEIDFKVRYHNTGTTNQLKVTVKDETSSDGLTYKVGSTHLKAVAADKKTVIADADQQDTWFTEQHGLIIGDYSSDQEAYLTYTMTVKDDKKLFPCGKVTPIWNNVAVATANGTMYDAVKINVKGHECAPGEMPKTGADGGEMIMMMLITISAMGGVAYMVFGVKMMHRKTAAMASAAQMNSQAQQMMREQNKQDK